MITEQSRAEQSRAEQSKAEQNRTDQSRSEQSRAEQSRAEQSRAEQSKMKQSKAEKKTKHKARSKPGKINQAIKKNVSNKKVQHIAHKQSYTPCTRQNAQQCYLPANRPPPFRPAT